jgi:hypothetical protein
MGAIARVLDDCHITYHIYNLGTFLLLIPVVFVLNLEEIKLS